MLSDIEMFAMIQKVQNEYLDIVYSIIPMPTKTAIRGMKDNDLYVWNVYRSGQITCEKI